MERKNSHCVCKREGGVVVNEIKIYKIWLEDQINMDILYMNLLEVQGFFLPFLDASSTYTYNCEVCRVMSRYLVRLGENPCVMCDPCWKNMGESKEEGVVALPLPNPKLAIV